MYLLQTEPDVSTFVAFDARGAAVESRSTKRAGWLEKLAKYVTFVLTVSHCKSSQASE